MKREDHLTVTVFGDHRASRTFLLPTTWIPKLSLLLCGMIGISVVSVGLAIRYYRISSASQPWKLRELEETISELKKRASAAPPVAPPALETQSERNQESTPPPNLSTPVGSLKTQDGLFSGIPLTVKKSTSEQSLSIEIGDLKADWSGKTLDVYFNIRYISKNSGNQQGRIVILAWGPETLLSYPAATLNPPGSPVMLAPRKGEFFSVSRFREVRAQFGPVASHETLSKVEVLLFSNSDDLLFHQILSPGQEMGSPTPNESAPGAPKNSTKSAPDSEVGGQTE